MFVIERIIYDFYFLLDENTYYLQKIGYISYKLYNIYYLKYNVQKYTQ